MRLLDKLLLPLLMLNFFGTDACRACRSGPLPQAEKDALEQEAAQLVQFAAKLQAQSAELALTSCELDAMRADLATQQGQVAAEAARLKAQGIELQQLQQSLDETRRVRARCSAGRRGRARCCVGEVFGCRRPREDAAMDPEQATSTSLFRLCRKGCTLCAEVRLGLRTCLKHTQLHLGCR